MVAQPNVDLARIVQVIQVLETRGTGDKNDPVRLVTSFWSLKGENLFEQDRTATITRSGRWSWAILFFTHGSRAVRWILIKCTSVS